MRIIRTFCYVGTLLVFIGCATPISEQASRIRITTAEEAKQYDYVGMNKSDRPQISRTLTNSDRDY